MNFITTIAASVLMSPANVATDVPAIQQDAAAYDWSRQQAISANTDSFRPAKIGMSMNGTSSYVGGYLTVDDWNTWD